MKEIAQSLIAWMNAGQPFALATIVSVSGSAPRALGTAMAVGADGSAVGSVSGGCVEAAVYTACQEVLVSGTGRLETFGYSNETAIAVGLTCGGTIDVWVERITANHRPLRVALEGLSAGRPVSIAHAVTGPQRGAILTFAFGNCVHRGFARDSVALQTKTLVESVAISGRYGPWAIDVYTAPPELIIFGATDHARALATLGKFCGYTVIVCDARPIFATKERFPDADNVVVDWPHRYLERATITENTSICVLTHDPKFDIPALKTALKTPAGYIGAMGSRRTHNERIEQLLSEGIPHNMVERLHSPIGLHLGGRTVQETALSIMAEITAQKNNAGVIPLHITKGPVHDPILP